MNRTIVLLLSGVSVWAQPWSGIIAPNRAIDWSNAGISGGIPSQNWTQCGSTTAPYGSSSSPGSTSTINTQISGCPANTYVQLGAGTFYLTGTINLIDSVEVRGMGANSTFLVFSGEGSCNGLYSQFCLAGSGSYVNGGEQNTAVWTAGFSQGTTSITLSNSLNITAGRTLIILDQQDEASDTGNIWNCDQTACGTNQGNSGAARTDNTCSSSVSPNVGFCSQQQQVLVTACSPSCNSSGSTVLTISPGLYMPNWRSSQSTGAFWANTTAYQRGVQNLSADLTNTTAGTSTAIIMNCYECWFRGVSSIDAARNHVWVYQSSRSIIRDNYFYQSTAHSSQSYGIELFVGSSDNLVENNICQQVTDSCPNNNGGGGGNVAAYNFAIDDVYVGANWFQPSDYDHAGGHSFWLREGNDGLGIIADDVHGTHHFTTAFRNRYPGYATAGCGGAGSEICSSNTSAVNLFGASRYFNVIGNVLGQAGYHTIYINEAPASNQNLAVYYLGGTHSGIFCAQAACTSKTTTSDPLTQTSIMLWGNYDTVNAVVRFVNSEVPSNFGDTTGTTSIYANPVPASQTLPASLVHSSKPSWFGNVPWPPTGPDVAGGNIGICSGGTYANSYALTSAQCAGGGTLVAAFGGHANANPAMVCYLNTMSGPPDGTGGVLSFNAAACYGLPSGISIGGPLTLAGPQVVH